MVFLKASKSVGSCFGMGTHVWLEITDQTGKKTTFSGSKNGSMLDVIRDYKRDYDREPIRGQLEISPPSGTAVEEWDEIVMNACTVVQDEMHGNYAFNGVWPWGKIADGTARSNCCQVLNRIVERAGGEMPSGKIKGIMPGLGRGLKDYLSFSSF